MMEIIRGQEPFPTTVKKSIFLLGPIPRTEATKPKSWKPMAYRILELLGFDGVVYDPEHLDTPEQRPTDVDYDNSPQINWEVEAMGRADIIVAWIPREFPDMPALTSNIEMGEWFKSGKLILGYPEDTPRMDYIIKRATAWLQAAYQWKVPICDSLWKTLELAVSQIGAGALRHDAETTVPLNIWCDKTFQQWYCSLEMGKHQLESLKVEYVYYRRYNKAGRPQSKVWAIRPRVRIADEDRCKDNEVVIGRPATTAVLMYRRSDYGVKDYKVVLVKEYRPAVMNHRGLVYELPGGAIEPLEGPFDERTILLSAMKEVEEETGLTLDASRLREFSVRQTMATLVACESHLYTYELDEAEFEFLVKKEQDQPVNVGDNEESTTVIVERIGELFGFSWPIDWVNMGMIMAFAVSEF